MKENLIMLVRWMGWKIIERPLKTDVMGKDEDGSLYSLGVLNPIDNLLLLDMMEDKMIDEGKILSMNYYFDKKPIDIHYTLEGKFYVGSGNTKNEAKLNSIINYVKRMEL